MNRKVKRELYPRHQPVTKGFFDWKRIESNEIHIYLKLKN
jgi:hypothetical protein